MSSPPTRGCSVRRPGLRRAPRVLPADAGVFRATAERLTAHSRPPRRRGGVPHSPRAPATTSASSPPTRGCSADRSRAFAAHGVLPADAGVFRTPAPPPTPGPRPPRRRGGVPPCATPLDGSSRSSPPTRGCSGRGALPRDRTQVLPADAGVFRRRGGRARGPSVLPADAGVFRPTGPRPPCRTCPPRRRGGVPSGTGWLMLECWSSPPTRGCSVEGESLFSYARVLPADAGVFRMTLVQPEATTRPPRRGGGVPTYAPPSRTTSGFAPPTLLYRAGAEIGPAAGGGVRQLVEGLTVRAAMLFVRSGSKVRTGGFVGVVVEGGAAGGVQG